MSSSADRAYDHIKRAILSGHFGSDARLREDQLATELGTSRTPIRDALRRLQVEQLVTITPYSGARIASWSKTELEEVAQMRAMLEPFAAGLAARKRAPATVQKLALLCDEMEAVAGSERVNLDLISANNFAFHRAIVEAADNARLQASIEPLWNAPMIIRKYGLFSPDRLQRSLQHHRELVMAIDKKDAEWAESVMRLHIVAARSFDVILGADAVLPADDKPQTA